MAKILRLQSKPVQVEARELTRDNIDEIAKWIHAENTLFVEDHEGMHVVFSFEDGWEMMQPVGWYICKDTKQNVWNQDLSSLLVDFDPIL